YTRRCIQSTPATVSNALALHDALPILAWSAGRRRNRPPSADRSRTSGCKFPEPRWQASRKRRERALLLPVLRCRAKALAATAAKDRKSTRLNSSHVNISYAVFCLKQKE